MPKWTFKVAESNGTIRTNVTLPCIEGKLRNIKEREKMLKIRRGKRANCHTHTHTCVHVHTQTHMHVYTHTREPTQTRRRAHTDTGTHTHTMYTHAHADVHAHTWERTRQNPQCPHQQPPAASTRGVMLQSCHPGTMYPINSLVGVGLAKGARHAQGWVLAIICAAEKLKAASVSVHTRPGR